ncbi:MAG: hypothetical protein K2H40_14770, partial [Lachnospiraceae bacterium]|nr:hypothetical protein [Lachnospiraceae bacterium]
MRSSNTNLVNRVTKAGRRDFFFQYLLLFMFLVFCIYQYSVHRLYGFSIYPDEFGYWASAAQWLGYDWSNVASLGYYYSFGYSLLLTPILWLCHDSITAYRAAVFINMSLQCVSIGLLWGIFRRLFCPVDCGAEENRIRKMQTVFAVGVAVFYPAWTFYTQMTLAEALLAFLYVFICYQFVLLLEDWKTGNVIIRILLLSIAFLYLHFVHMRTVGVAAAAVLVLAFYLWHRPGYRKLLYIFAAVLIIGASAGLCVKGIVTDTVYATADAGNLAVNDYVGKLRILKGMFTWNGIKQFLQSCAGKLYYLGMASFGLFYPAAACCIKRSAVLLHNFFRKNEKKEKRKTDWFYFFLFLSMLGQFMVVAVSVKGTGRLDSIIYGRYNEYLLPVFMGIGIWVLLNTRHLLWIFGCSVGIS